MGCAGSKSKKSPTKASVVPYNGAHHRRDSSLSTIGTMSKPKNIDWVTPSGHNVKPKTSTTDEVIYSDLYQDTSITHDCTPVRAKALQIDNEYQQDNNITTKERTMAQIEGFGARLRSLSRLGDSNILPSRVTERATEEDIFDDTVGEIERISSFVRYSTVDLLRMQSLAGVATVISNDDTLERAGDFRMNTEQLLASVTTIDFTRTDTFDHASPDLSPDKRKKKLNNFVRDKSFTWIPEDASAEETMGKGDDDNDMHDSGAVCLPTQYFFIDNEDKPELSVGVNLPREYEIFVNLVHNGDVIKGSVLYSSHGEKRNVQCRFPHAGEYQLNILAKKRHSQQEYVGVFTYFIDNAGAFDGVAQFPDAVSMTVSEDKSNVNSGYLEDVEIICPLSRVLRCGQEYPVTVLAPHVDEIKYAFDNGDKKTLQPRGDFFGSKIEIPQGCRTLKLVWTDRDQAVNMIKYTIEN